MTNNIILLIFDYYILSYFTPIDCDPCKSVGYQLFYCPQCNGNGQYTVNCEQCDQNGIHQYDVKCSICHGSGAHIKSHQCTKCDGGGICVAVCRKCGGDGRFIRNGYDKGICFTCNGMSAYTQNCFRCDGSGICKQKKDCWRCKGTCVISKRELCINCKGANNYQQECDNCNGKGEKKYECSNCDGHKQILGIDYNKLCDRQSLCDNCNRYFPNDMVFNWSKECCHTFCYQCISLSVKNQINDNRVPICLIYNCPQNLVMKQLQLMNIIENEYYNKLNKLLSKPYKCHKCAKMTSSKHEFSWTKCGHKFCKKCASKIINQSLCINKKPRCIVLQCNQLLNNRDAGILNDSLLMRYQFTSKEMRKYYNPQEISITIDCYHCHSEGHILFDCVSCQGFGYVENVKHPVYDVYKCRGFGYNRRKCNKCNGLGGFRYSCFRCNGQKRICILDLNKLCNNQLLCNKCNQYFTKEKINDWSKHCLHTFCYECIEKYIPNEIQQQRIPFCLSAKCCQELTPEKIQSFSIQNKSKLSLLLTMVYYKNKFYCTVCGIWHYKKDKRTFVWSNCGHQYCYESIPKIINHSLSIWNEIPKCVHPTCHQNISIKDAVAFKDYLLTKYKFNKQNICENNCLKGLRYFTKINCSGCKSVGYHLFDCEKCDCKGWNEISCGKCKSTGVLKNSIQCIRCVGSGKRVRRSQCSDCEGTGTYSPGRCRRCSGTGEYIIQDYNHVRGVCFGCKGTGRYKTDCRKCDKKGICKTVYECVSCDGKGMICKKIQCNRCRGVGKYGINCDN
eukprot:340451_1